MKVIILAGGLGTRLSEYTEVIPKPMIRIGGRPMLWHIMKIYSHFGIKDFYLALGYKSEVVKNYFLTYKELHSNITVDLENNSVSFHQTDDLNWRITMVDTGANTMTGGRVKNLKDFIGNETCMMTYGDGLANINIDELLKFHKMHGKLITITTVQPQSRYGELSIKKDKVTSFKEKPQNNNGWINGGFFIFEPEFFDLIKDDSTILEKTPLEKAAETGQLMAYRHDGFWFSMDSKRDHEILEKIWKEGDPPWIM
jgi:glucose-1-phosphate cytidylyltransferase